MTKNKKYYYDVEDDLKQYPDAWCYIIVGGRNTGKTYSTLKYYYLLPADFTFLKRTNEDVKLLCAGSGRIGSKVNEYGVDLSPFKSINRDLHSNVKAFSIFDGLGGFWKCDEEDAPIGKPIGYICSLNAVNKVKGFDLSESKALIFDEFIPQPWERVNRKEGEQLMDMYKTVSRDREHRGQEPLKLICLANAVSIYNPVMEMLEITDDVVMMEVKNQTHLYLEERGILIHRVEQEDFKEEESKSAVYKAMKDTSWGKMALQNTFAYDDFTNIGTRSLRGMKPYMYIKYKTYQWYVYQKDGEFYCCKSKTANFLKEYNLNTENGQKAFFNHEYFRMRDKCTEGKFLFSNYTMYYTIINFKKVFQI